MVTRSLMRPPASVARHLAGVRGTMSGETPGRVAELDRSPAGGIVGLSAVAKAARGQGERYDAVLSLGGLDCLATPDEVFDALALVRAALATDGRFHFAEPVARPDWPGRFQRFVGRPPFRHPALIRSAGFTITDLERPTLASRHPHWRWWVQGTARPT